MQALPDKLQVERFTQSPSRAPSVSRSVPTLNELSEMSPCTQLDDMSHFPSATCCFQRGAFLIFCLSTAVCQVVRLGSLLSNELFPYLAMSIAYTYSSNVKYFWSANFRLFFFFYQLEKHLETLKQKPYLKSLAQNLRNPGPTEGTRFLHLPCQTTAIDQISDRIFT